MRVGAENRRQVLAAVVLAVLAAASLWYGLGSRPAPPPASSQPAAQGRAATRVVPGRRTVAPPTSLDPTLRLDLLQASEGVKYAGAGRNIFRPQEEPPEIPRPIESAIKKTPAPPPGPPPPPPIDLKFFGFASKPGDPSKRVFLSQGPDIFIAGEGDIVNRRYRVVRIGANSVEIEDVLYNNRQTIPLTQG